MSAVYTAIRAIIQNTPYYTHDPSEACLFVPSVDVSCWCENCLHGAFSNIIDRQHRVSLEIGQKLRSLPYWNNGINHILFELSDAPCMPYDIGQAIAAKSGLSEFHLRSGHDISMPLFGMVEFSEAQRRLPPAARKFLLTFRGTRSERSDAMRNELYRIHNGEDIVLLIACRWFGESRMNGGQGYDSKCAEEEKRFQEYTFTELSVESKFALIVEGFGYHSFRLTEMMSAGSIPVICVDHYVPPYSDILDWDNFSIRVPEHKFEQVRIAVGQREYIFACGVCIYRLIHQPCIEAHELATALTPSLCTMISQTRCCLLESILLSFNKVYEQHTVLHD
jgi:glucuronyl/N-acetylglucosaminyl transferase EXT1